MTKPYPTPHIAATPEAFAKTVLMPGDPLRAKFIAENFLENAKLVNNVRGIQGYTGTYKGARVSVMASGMGMPSIGIYSYELYNFFGVENIMRIGSAGALDPKIKVRDIVMGMGASTNSNFASQYHLPGTFSAICSYETNAQMPPLDVLISIATVLHVSLDQLAGLNNEKKITLAGLSAPQKDIIELLLSEFVSPTSDGPSLSPQQIQILQALILLFSSS